ncbi:hypothetical protein GTQ55_02505 [Microbulbifer hydrolyticus]|uniref:Uncharacterized protein n=2 Tax=Microbulbifer hydrolyticus TaxID=48074 RepID=A0A6P1T7H1_9GAMM|nr:hypothetical protein [Microbulbifer hydrolyticus]MBB5211254.1 hypothetical protein [Microbulbifer hydrolyticus]QHQ37977.1 hypothetical protein GTQ55_02505 [Microbulbifer hydrolyticus]
MNTQVANWLLDRTLVIRFLALLLFIWVLVGFNSNAPKLVLQPDCSAEQKARERALQVESGAVENFAPKMRKAEETSAHLESLRDEQQAEVTGEETPDS